MHYNIRQVDAYFKVTMVLYYKGLQNIQASEKCLFLWIGDILTKLYISLICNLCVRDCKICFQNLLFNDINCIFYSDEKPQT